MLFIEKIRSLAQKTSITLESWLISFVGIVFVRIFFEQFSSFQAGRFVLIDLPTIINYLSFFLAAIVWILVVSLFFTKLEFSEMSVLALFAFCTIWIPPLIDLATAGVGGHIMRYVYVSGPELFLRFITYFGGHITSGATLGIQVEGLLILLGTFIFVRVITQNTRRALTASFCLYCVIFLLGTTPSFIGLFLTKTTSIDPLVQSIVSSHIISNNIHPQFSATPTALADVGFNKLLTQINSIIALIGLFLLFLFSQKKKLYAVLANSRPERIFHYSLLIVFGVALSHQNVLYHWIDLLSLFVMILSFASAWLFSVFQNDIYDEAIDSISNKNRPLIAKTLSQQDMVLTSKIFLIISLLLAYAVGHYTLFFVGLFIFLSHIYSSPPLRLRRFFPINSFIVALACLSAILSGFFLMSPDESIIAFPTTLTLGILVFFTLGLVNFKDIKDIAGDKAAGIQTLPVLLGEKKSKQIIAGILCLFFLAIPFYFRISVLLIPSIITSILTWRFITAKIYEEWKFFLVYNMYLLLIITTISLNIYSFIQ